ncbi:MAG: hypothetical protein ACOY40_14970 [Bacillota bacterium]
MTARDNKQKVTDSCPKQEADIQNTCDPCEATACDVEGDTGCDPCE